MSKKKERVSNTILAVLDYAASAPIFLFSVVLFVGFFDESQIADPAFFLLLSVLFAYVGGRMMYTGFYRFYHEFYHCKENKNEEEKGYEG